MIMSSETANEAAEIPVSEGVQENNPKYSDAEVVVDLNSEDSESAMLKLGEYYDHIEEPPWKAVGKDNHSKTRKDGEEVIQYASNLVNL